MMSSSQWVSLVLIMHKELEANPYRSLAEVIVIPLVLIGLCLNSFSRMLLGMHSIDQVVFGAFLGTLLSFFLFQLTFHKFKEDLLQKIRTNKKQIYIFILPQLLLVLIVLIGEATFQTP